MLAYETHNTNDLIDINGTALIGFLRVPGSRLRAVLGEPFVNEIDPDTKLEWHVRITDLKTGDIQIVTVYDYNRGDAAIEDVDFDNWNVGGHSRIGLNWLTEILNWGD